MLRGGRIGRLIGVLGLAGALMGETCGYDGTRRDGETCTRMDDCEEGLSCTAGRCSSGGDGGGDAEPDSE